MAADTASGSCLCARSIHLPDIWRSLYAAVPFFLLCFRLTYVWIALVVVYDFHPNSQTTAETYFKSKAILQGGRVQQQERINESTLWSYIFQIASAMKAVHEAGLAVRMIDASKILITGQNRHVHHHSIHIATSHSDVDLLGY